LRHQVKFNNPVVESFRASGSALAKQPQCGFWNDKFSETTIQADHKFRNYQDMGLINVFQPAEMNSDLCRELG
jgi:hypothetical protein